MTLGVTSDRARGSFGSLDSPQVKVSQDGTTAAAIWRNGTDAGTEQAATASVSGATATWGSATTASGTGQSVGAPQIAASSDGTRATVVWHRFVSKNPSVVQSRSSMLLVPGAPTLSFENDTLTITPPADSGGSPVTEYQILYTTQARIDAGKAAGVWATFWPASSPDMSFAAYQKAAPCTVVAATAAPYPGRCAHPLGEHTAGRPFVYQVAAINDDGRGPFTNITVTR